MSVHTSYIPRFFDLTPIPLKENNFNFPTSDQPKILEAKLDKCRRHIAKLETTLSYRRTDKGITSLLIQEFKVNETRLLKELKESRQTANFGKLYRAKMPVGISQNPENPKKAIDELKAAKITHLFLLCMDEECKRATGIDLRKFYTDNGIEVIHFPVKDYGAWDQKPFNEKIYQLHNLLINGANVVVHCMGGIGRTGTIISAELVLALKLDDKQAIGFVRHYSNPNSVETSAQKTLIKNFAESVLANAKYC